MAGPIKVAVEKELTCPLCLDLFKQPKKLPCDHVYCKDCLKGLALRSLNQSISCPECRNVTDIPGNDINNFPTAFRINRLIEAFQGAREQTDYHRQDTTDIPGRSCTVHTRQLLALYCETCKIMLCRDCVLMTKEHIHHEYDYVENIAKKYRERHNRRLLMTEEYKELLCQLQSRISLVERTIDSEKTANLEEIDHAFEDLLSTLEQSKQAMKRQLSQEYQQALNTVLEHKEQLENAQKEAAQITTLIKGTLGEQNEAIIKQEELIENDIKNLQQDIDKLPSTVEEPSLPVAEVMSCETLQQNLDSCNFLYIPADPKKCQMEGSFLRRAETGKYHTLTLDLIDSKQKKCLRGSQKIKAELCSTRDATTTIGRIKHLSPHNVSIIFDKLKRGRNVLRVTLRGTHIANSPHSIYVHKPPSQLCQPVAQIRNLERPTGLTKCGDSILAVEHSRNRILKLNTFFERVAVYGQGQLSGPSELTTDQQMNIYVCTVLDHRVHKFNSDGVHIKSTGTQGTLPGQFRFPNGLRINSQEDLYICDSENNRIQVFDLQLNFKRVFGEPGTRKGQFMFPSDVDFDSSDNIYVSDSYNHRIQVFTPQGRFIHIIGYKRFGSKELERPLNMHVLNDLLYVTEFQKNHITVFKTSGEFVTTFGKGVLQQPEGIEVDIDGYIYVTSHFSKVFIF